MLNLYSIFGEMLNDLSEKILSLIEKIENRRKG